ncbi:MAG TPA: gamma carbonic anhydrase family protein [Phycisphaerae bacterium]|nr:gamma carbonic anhydrase family protein [Phycisphaerae bacterium]
MSALPSTGFTIVENARTLLGKNVYIAPTSYVGGAVTIGDDTAVMHYVCIRGDVSAIRIGARVNVQDGTVIHTHGGVDLDIEDDVSIGHRAVVHCTRVMTGALIGIGSIVLDGSVIGRQCIVAAGAVVAPNTIVPDGKLLMGVPARIVRDVSDKEREYLRYVVRNYVELGRRHARGEYANAVGART